MTFYDDFLFVNGTDYINFVSAPWYSSSGLPGRSNYVVDIATNLPKRGTIDLCGNTRAHHTLLLIV